MFKTLFAKYLILTCVAGNNTKQIIVSCQCQNSKTYMQTFKCFRNSTTYRQYSFRYVEVSKSVNLGIHFFYLPLSGIVKIKWTGKKNNLSSTQKKS